MKRRRPPVHQIEFRVAALPELFRFCDTRPFMRRRQRKLGHAGVQVLPAKP